MKWIWFLIFFSLSMIGLMAIMIKDIFVSKVVMDGTRVISVNVFRTRILLYSEIKGYRKDEYHFILVPKNTAQKGIRISKLFMKSSELSAWLASNVLNLDQYEEEIERSEILKNVEFGWTEEQRIIRLSNANKVALGLNILGVCVGLWAFFYPHPYQYVIVVALVIILLSISSLNFSEGLIRIRDKEHSGYPDIVLAVLFPSLGLSLRAFIDISILDYTNAWLPIILLTLFMFFGLSFRNEEIDRKTAHFRGTIFVLLFIAINFGYGSSILLNTKFDQSEPVKYTAHVVGKRIENHKIFFFRLKLAPWGPQKDTTEVNVPLDIYESVKENDQVRIWLKKGVLNIPWYYIDKSPPTGRSLEYRNFDLE